MYATSRQLAAANSLFRVLLYGIVSVLGRGAVPSHPRTEGGTHGSWIQRHKIEGSLDTRHTHHHNKKVYHHKKSLYNIINKASWWIKYTQPWSRWMISSPSTLLSLNMVRFGCHSMMKKESVGRRERWMDGMTGGVTRERNVTCNAGTSSTKVLNCDGFVLEGTDSNSPTRCYQHAGYLPVGHDHICLLFDYLHRIQPLR